MMFGTLRRRFIVSHVLPTLLILPLMGIALIYVLETQVLLVNLSRGLMAQAELVADLTADRSGIWDDPAQAIVLVTHLSTRLDAKAMLLDAGGQLLASSDSADVYGAVRPFQHPDWATVLAGETSVRTTYSQDLHAEIVEVLAPVLRSDQQAVGVVRLSHRLTSVQERFLRLRFLIGGVLVAGLLLGALVGLVLALNLERPIRQVTQAVWQVTTGERTLHLEERGPQEIRLLERAVNTLVERLRVLEQTRRQLLANLVHELRRPLGALRSATHALLSGASDDVPLREELLQGMDAQMQQLQRLIDDLSSLYDQLGGTLQLERALIALEEWLAQTLGYWGEAAREKGLRWQATIPAGLPAIEVDPDRLGQAVGNLLSNAIKYTPTGGSVSVGAGVEDEAVWIRVNDTGPGVAPGEQERIFDPFYRGNAAGRFPRGMGLGLTIARDLVAAHGGRIEVDSDVGLGSRFTIWLPLPL
jgi:two-component system sensor histidine kinase BaeS